MSRWGAIVAITVAALGPFGPRAFGEAMLLGVGTHVGFGARGTDPSLVRHWLGLARIHSVRDEMYWWHTETPDGRLVLSDGALATAEAWRSMPASFYPLLILSYGHPRYDGGGQPRSPQAVEAFGRYAEWVVSHARPVARMVEVWNEWNLRAGARPEGGSQGDPVDYVRLAAATYRTLKDRHPGLSVLVGSMGEDFRNWDWTRRALAAGLLEAADGLSVHLYNQCMRASRVGADEAIERLDELRGLVDAASRRSLPIYVTEVGWPTHAGRCGVTEDDAARHTIRFLLQASLRTWVGGVWLYELVDSGDDPRDMEHRFGLLDRQGRERPAGCAVRELGALIAQRPREVVHQDGVMAARFGTATGDRLILWNASAGRSHRVHVRLAGSDARGAAVPEVCGLARGSQVEVLGQTGARLALHRSDVVVLDVERAAGVTLSVR